MPTPDFGLKEGPGGAICGLYTIDCELDLIGAPVTSACIPMHMVSVKLVFAAQVTSVW